MLEQEETEMYLSLSQNFEISRLCYNPSYTWWEERENMVQKLTWFGMSNGFDKKINIFGCLLAPQIPQGSVRS